MELEITIPRWSELNPRGDIKNPQWCRLERDFFAALVSLPTAARYLWVVLVAMATRRRGVVDVDVDTLSTVVGVDDTVVVDLVDLLRRRRKIVVNIKSSSKDGGVDDNNCPDIKSVYPSTRKESVQAPLLTVQAPPDHVTDGRTNGRTDERTENERSAANASALSPVAVAPRARARRRRRPAGVAPSWTASDLAVGREWLAFARRQCPWRVDDASWTEERFAEAVGAVRRATGVTEAGMAELLAFVAADDFWSQNAISPASLLKRGKSGERKIDSILVRYRSRPAAKTVDALRAWAATPDTIDAEQPVAASAQTPNDGGF